MLLKNTMIAAGLLALTTGVASANPAVVQQDLHMRAGPGPQYGMVTVMPQGADVRAWNCDGAWCRVSYNGRSGFASERYLDIGQARVIEPEFRGYAYAPGYRDYAYAPGYRNYAYYEPAPLPNPLDFPLLPWNW
jgi:uncharacterized protein YraI